MGWRKISYPPEALVLATGETDPATDDTEGDRTAQNIVDCWSLQTAAGKIIFSVDEVSVYVRRPGGGSTDRLRLSDKDYELDSKTGIDGLERVVGLSPADLDRLIEGQWQDGASLAWDD